MSDHLPDPHPEYRELADEVALLREELAHLLTEEHEQIEIEQPNLLALYQQKIGAWELRRLQAQVAAMRAKRRLELALAAVHYGGAPDWAAIDEALAEEFLRWQRLVQETANRLSAADHRLSHLLGPGEDRELKKLYHALVKALHPDLHPGFTEGQRRLWQRGQDAYERRDLTELRALLVLAEDAVPAPAAPGAIETLRADRAALQRQIAEIERRIGERERQPPFTLRAQLQDDVWVGGRRTALDAEIALFESQLAACEQQLATWQKLTQDGKEFGPN